VTPARWGRYPDRASARRAAARELHPDRGGSAADFAAALREIDAHFAPPPVRLTVRHTRRLRLLHPRRLRRRRRRYIQL